MFLPLGVPHAKKFFQKISKKTSILPIFGMGKTMVMFKNVGSQFTNNPIAKFGGEQRIVQVFKRFQRFWFGFFGFPTLFFIVRILGYY
jgi:hypothetical protein